MLHGYLRIDDDQDYGATVAIYAANDIEEAKFLATGCHSRDEYIEKNIAGIRYRCAADEIDDRLGFGAMYDELTDKLFDLGCRYSGEPREVNTFYNCEY